MKNNQHETHHVRSLHPCSMYIYIYIQTSWTSIYPGIWFNIQYSPQKNTQIHPKRFWISEISKAQSPKDHRFPVLQNHDATWLARFLQSRDILNGRPPGRTTSLKQNWRIFVLNVTLAIGHEKSHSKGICLKISQYLINQLGRNKNCELLVTMVELLTHFCRRKAQKLQLSVLPNI